MISQQLIDIEMRRCPCPVLRWYVYSIISGAEMRRKKRRREGKEKGKEREGKGKR